MSVYWDVWIVCFHLDDDEDPGEADCYEEATCDGEPARGEAEARIAKCIKNIRV